MSPAAAQIAPPTPGPTAAGSPSGGLAPAPVRLPLRRIRDITLFAAVLLLAAFALALLAPKQGDVYLDPDGTGQQGIGALVSVVRDQGVDVTTVETLDKLGRQLDALSTTEPVTVAVGPTDYLTPAGARSLLATLRPVDRLVLLDGGGPVLRSMRVGLDVLPMGGNADDIKAGCRTPFTRDDPTVNTFAARLVDDDSGSLPQGLTSCFSLKDSSDVFHGRLMVVLPATTERPEVVAIGFGPALTNRRIVDADHAALGVRLLGGHARTIVYTPSITDSLSTSGAPEHRVSPPEWIGPALALSVCALIAYAVAAGRRMGRLVPEPLPVVIAASEATHSRGELYRAARDRGRAADALRAGTLARLGPRLRLGPRPSMSAVLDALASHGIPVDVGGPRSVQHLLTGPAPTDDAGLVRLAQDLATLEEKVDPR